PGATNPVPDLCPNVPAGGTLPCSASVSVRCRPLLAPIVGPWTSYLPLRLRSRVTARERKRRRLIREAEALERKAAAIRASLVSKGEAREALENVERRFLAWWSGGGEQTGLDGNWRDPRDAARRIGGATVADLVSAAGVALREA